LATDTLSHALADCLECIENGEDVEACLDRYPEHRASLQPLLEVARALQEHRLDSTPRTSFIDELKTILTNTPSSNQKGGETHTERS
jgi:hypothetical protein